MAYIPPHKRNLPPPPPVAVVGELLPAYDSRAGNLRYVGPRVTLFENGIGLIGRPHIQFQMPSKSIRGEFKFVSSDDHFSLVIGCEPDFTSSQWAMPDTGLHFEIRAEKINIWQRPHNDESPILLSMFFGKNFCIPPERRTIFELTLIENQSRGTMKASFVLKEKKNDEELNDDQEAEVQEYRIEIELPKAFTSGDDEQTTPLVNQTAVLYNREKGRLSILHDLVLDGESYFGELMHAIDENNLIAEGVLGADSDLFPQLKVKIMPAMEFQTTP